MADREVLELLWMLVAHSEGNPTLGVQLLESKKNWEPHEGMTPEETESFRSRLNEYQRLWERFAKLGAQKRGA